jgi:hypothetical protein
LYIASELNSCFLAHINTLLKPDSSSYLIERLGRLLIDAVAVAQVTAGFAYLVLEVGGVAVTAEDLVGYFPTRVNPSLEAFTLAAKLMPKVI